MEVVLNVYDLHSSNNLLQSVGGGFFHTGVEINGYEFSFSQHGVVRTRPRLPEFGQLREQKTMGTYPNGMNEIYNIISRLRNAEFQPGSYDIIHRNCNHFSDAFCFELLNEHIPVYINRMAGAASNFSQPSNRSPSHESFAAPGFVKAPCDPLEKQKTSSSKTFTSSSSSVRAATTDDTSLFSTVFGWFGGSSVAPQSAPDSQAVQPQGQSTEIRAETAKPISKHKELTEKQKELLAKIKK